MKKLFFAVSALAALSLLAPSSGFAWDPSHLGLYADEAATSWHIMDAAPYSSHTIYVVLTNPTQPDGTTEVDFVGGFECMIIPSGGLVTGTVFPVESVNVGTNTNIIVGFADPVAVGPDRIVTVATVTYVLTVDSATFTLGLPDPPNPNNPTAMTFLDASLNELPCYPSSSDWSLPVFGVNDDTPVGSEVSSFGSVKSLYR